MPGHEAADQTEASGMSGFLGKVHLVHLGVPLSLSSEVLNGAVHARLHSGQWILGFEKVVGH